MSTFFEKLGNLGLGFLGLLALFAIVSLTAKRKSRFGKDCQGTGSCANCTCGKQESNQPLEREPDDQSPPV